MGLFVKKTFEEKLDQVKSVFKEAFNEAFIISSECDDYVKVKEGEIEEIKKEIKATETVKAEADAFMEKLKDFV